MPQQFTNHKGEPILLTDTNIATGGEGAIFEVVSPHQKVLVAKIYHTQALRKAREHKIRFMHDNNPTHAASEDIKKAIVWVEELLYKNKEFVGFTMPQVSNAITLKSLTLAQNPSKKFGATWQKFDHDVQGSHQKRLVVAYNLVQAINTIHEWGNYVLVDLKPENIFIKPDASIALVDLDGIQILGEGINFASKVFTEEYAPPEKHQDLVDHQAGNVDKEWDYFSLSVIIYELLFGIHPYQASHKTLTTRPELIKEGLFVQGSNKAELYKIPHVHQNFEKLHPQLKKAFFNTFVEGHTATQFRTSPNVWAQSLLSVVNLPSVYNTQIDLKPLPTVPQKPSSAKIINEEQSSKPKNKKGIVLLFQYLFPLVVFFTILGLLWILTKPKEPSSVNGKVGDVIEGQVIGEDWEENPRLSEQAQFDRGSSAEDVIKIQGEPDYSITEKSGQIKFLYGESIVYILDGEVTHYSNIDGALKVPE